MLTNADRKYIKELFGLVILFNGIFISWSFALVYFAFSKLFAATIFFIILILFVLEANNKLKKINKKRW